MSSKSKRLGSLADIFQSESLDGTVRKIKLTKIKPSERQPRQDRLKSINELSESIKDEGLLQPIVVNKIENEDLYKIIAGERRFHAVSKLGWTEVECKILNKSDKEIYKLAVIENLQRENLSAFDEVESLKILKKEYSYSDQELATIFGKSRNYISEILSISQLSQGKIDECKEVGIENKNLLIQASQADKKGSFKEFIEKFKAGKLKTVREAKEFNKAKTETPKNPILRIEKKKNKLIVYSENTNILNTIENFIRNLK